MNSRRSPSTPNVPDAGSHIAFSAPRAPGGPVARRLSGARATPAGNGSRKAEPVTPGLALCERGRRAGEEISHSANETNLLRERSSRICRWRAAAPATVVHACILRDPASCLGSEVLGRRSLCAVTLPLPDGDGRPSLTSASMTDNAATTPPSPDPDPDTLRDLMPFTKTIGASVLELHEGRGEGAPGLGARGVHGRRVAPRRRHHGAGRQHRRRVRVLEPPAGRRPAPRPSSRRRTSYVGCGRATSRPRRARCTSGAPSSSSRPTCATRRTASSPGSSRPSSSSRPEQALAAAACAAPAPSDAAPAPRPRGPARSPRRAAGARAASRSAPPTGSTEKSISSSIADQAHPAHPRPVHPAQA